MGHFYRYLELKQAGLDDYWRVTFTGGRTTCYRSLLTKNKKTTRLRKLTLVDLGSAFFLLGVNILISLLLFVVEQYQRYKSLQVRRFQQI